ALSAFPILMYPLLNAAVKSAPAIAASSPFYVNLWTAPDAYGDLLQPMFWPLALAVLAVAFAGKNLAAKDGGSMPSHELATLVGFAAIPVFAVLLAAATTGTFSLRYGIPGVIGIACLVVWAGARWSAGNAPRSGAAVALTFFLFFAGAFAHE